MRWDSGRLTNRMPELLQAFKIPHPNRRSAGKAAAGGLASAISANLRTIGNKSRHALHSLAGKCIRHSVFSIWHSIWLTVHRAATM
uniref:MIP20603p n=1 Tax=Drosophila melanogaster TaxID=7227 RepID=D5A7R1_DROME|nr:MIP20603p [Drosophila melanogaster]